jgi:hypothetical protein
MAFCLKRHRYEWLNCSGYIDIAQSEQAHFYRSGEKRFPKSDLRKTVQERFRCEHGYKELLLKLDDCRF